MTENFEALGRYVAARDRAATWGMLRVGEGPVVQSA